MISNGTAAPSRAAREIASADAGLFGKLLLGHFSPRPDIFCPHRLALSEYHFGPD